MMKNICLLRSNSGWLINFYTHRIKNFGAYRGNPALSREYEKERAEYKKLRKEVNKKHINEFWNEQTKIENEFLEDFEKTQKEKKVRDDARLRTVMIKTSFQLYSEIQTQLEKQKEFLAKQKKWREEETHRLLEKQSILNFLDKQAEEDWLTPENIEDKLSHQMNKILPPTILSHVDYYNRLNKYALLMETGQLEEAEEVKLNKQVIEYKNKLLQPIFMELKMIIKHLTYTEEHSVYTLYKDTIFRIENYLYASNNKTEVNNLKENLTILFKRLICLIRSENEKADTKIEIIEKQLKALTMILVVWNKYVEIIYTPENKIEEMIDRDKQINQEITDKSNHLKNKSLEEMVEEKDPRVLKDYYFSQITDKKAKGGGLFINDLRGLYDDEYVRKEVEDKSGYQNIEIKKKVLEEEYTTDSDQDEVSEEPVSKLKEPLLNKSSNKDTLEKKSEVKIKKKTLTKTRTSIHAENRKLLENESSELFEEFEEEEKITENVEVSEIKYPTSSVSSTTSTTQKVFSDPLSPSPTNTNLTPVEKIQKKEKNQRKLLEEYMLIKIKNEAEKSNYSNIDVEYEFKNFKKNLIKDLGLQNENDLFSDIDRDLEKVDLSKIIDVNEYENELKKENNRMTLEKEFNNANQENLFSSSLFENIVKYSKDIFDFQIPKISTDLDIYDENLIKFLEYTIEESNLTYKSGSSSLIMEFIQDELKIINDEELSVVNKLKKKNLIKIASIVGKLRITDSQNLKQVFDINKNPTIKF